MRPAGSTPGVAVGISAALALLFLAGTALPPVLDAAGIPGESAVRAFYRPLCHQFPWRSFWLEGQPLALCARCTGLYLGGFLGLLAAALHPAWRRRAPRIGWLAVAVAPTLVDVGARGIGLAGLAEWPRFLVGIPAGFAVGLCLAVGIADLASLTNTSLTSAREPRAAADRANGRSS